MSWSEDNIHFEESIVDDFGEFSKLERPINNNIFIFVGLVVLATLLMTLIRISSLGLIWGDFYNQRALANINKEVIIPSQRGLIFDRFNKPLLKNSPSFSVYLNLTAIFKKGESEEADQKEKIDAVIKQVSQLLNLKAEDVMAELGKINLENNDRLVLARDIPLDQAINTRTLNLEGVEVADDYKRDYIDGPVFAHVLGYTTGRADDVVGVSGLEASYDNFLRGIDGEYSILRDVKGNDIDKKNLKEAKPGDRLVTTIDSEFQNYFYNRLEEGLASLGRKAGIGLAINPQTGEILSLVNLPSFNNNDPAKYLSAAGNPLFNRAVAGTYNPGSTIKPLVALAALKEKVVTPMWEAYSNGFLELPNPYDPTHPSRFLDWKAHGWVDLHSALARSSNIYFYIVGGGCPMHLNCETSGSIKGLGIEKLKEYWEKFGLNETTGVDLNSEAVGFLPDPTEKKERTGQIWRIGDTYNVSIGQGDLTVTPLRLLTFIASIANGGKVYRPHLVQKILDEKENLLKEIKTEELMDYSDWWPEIKEVQKGLRDAVAQPYGTANRLYDLLYKTAAKTGSAQIQNNTKTNAFFVGYGPYEKPQIAILVLVEDAKEGSINTLPIAKDVLNWYYQHRL